MRRQLPRCRINPVRRDGFRCDGGGLENAASAQTKTAGLLEVRRDSVRGVGSALPRGAFARAGPAARGPVAARLEATGLAGAAGARLEPAGLALATFARGAGGKALAAGLTLAARTAGLEALALAPRGIGLARGAVVARRPGREALAARGAGLVPRLARCLAI